MADIKLDPGEAKIDSWTIMYIAPGGERFNGKLTVTDKRLLYDAKFDMSVGSLINQAYLIEVAAGSLISFPKSQIKKVDSEKGFFSKKVIVIMEDDSIHTFNYGMLSVDKLLDAVRVGCKL